MPKKRKMEGVGGPAAATAGGMKDKLGVGADKQDKMAKRNDLPSTSKQQQQPDANGVDGVLPWMRSFNGPVSNDNNGQSRTSDWNALLAIFPEEVWMIILESIPDSDADTLESLSNASPVFRDLLMSRRVQFLFPKVWNILGPKYHEAVFSTAINEPFQEPRNYNSRLPWSRRRSPPGHWDFDPTDLEDSPRSKWHTGIIKLRMVCRSWCEAMDQWYENQQFRRNRTRSSYATIAEGHIDALATDEFHTGSPDHLELFGGHFESTHSRDSVAIRNPFLGRSVSLRLGRLDDENVAQFLNLLRNLFLRYGRYIWYLEIGFVVPGMDTMDECYSTLRTFLQAAPNLKTLCVTFEPTSLFQISGSLNVRGRGQWNWFQSYINSRPLPTLESLRLLATKSGPEAFMPEPVFRELIKTSGGGVSVLEYDHRHYTIGDYNISSVTVPKLTQLSLRIQSDEEFETFFNSSAVHWRLSSLELELFHGTVSVAWDQIFQELEVRWADTLTCLRITLPLERGTENQNMMEEVGGNFRLNLPRLTHLKLDMPNLRSLDFLLPLSNSLEDLDLEVNAIVQGLGPSGLVKRFEKGKRVQLLSRPHKPMDSNIWTLFQKLKRLRLDFGLWSGAEVRKDTLWYVKTWWEVRRRQWQNWDKETKANRRRKLNAWKIRRAYH